MRGHRVSCGFRWMTVFVVAVLSGGLALPTLVWAQGKSLGGSDIVAVGPNPIPAGAQVLCFSVVVHSDDVEYLDRLDIDLPDSWIVDGVWPDSVPLADGCVAALPPVVGVDSGNVVYWQSVGYPPQTGCGAWMSGTFEFCVDVTVPDGSGAPWVFSWFMYGDGWGADPHVVSNVFGPVDFDPGGVPDIDVDPLSLSSFQGPDEVFVSGIDINNVGDSTLDWFVEEEPETIRVRTSGPMAQWVLNRPEPQFVSFQLPVETGPAGVPLHTIKGARDLLFDQTDNAGSESVTSQDFETANDAYDNQAADDFFVPPEDVSWSVEQIEVAGAYFNGSGPAWAVNVWFFEDAAGLPGQLVYEAYGLAPNDPGGLGNLTIDLIVPAVLSPGVHWLSVQAVLDFSVAGQWGWTERTLQSLSESAWRNPNSGFGTPCTDWGPRVTSCGIGGPDPDLVFRLNGSTGAGGFNCSSPADVPWLSVAPVIGATPPAGTSPIDVLFDSTGLSAGSYLANLCVFSSDPDPGPGNGTELVVVPVNLVVGVGELIFEDGFESEDMSQWSNVVQ